MGEYSLSQALQQFLKQSRLKGNIQALQIEAVWEELMGKTIAKYTDNIQIINQTLFITTSVAPLKNELMFQKEKIIQRVNEALGERVIKDVVIK
jgi:predicted nucleic acid-binding Zn ribbon protein